MRKLFVCMLGIILLAACHSESDFSGEGTAEVSLCLLADPSFVKTKAIDVLAYQNVDIIRWSFLKTVLFLRR